LHIPLARHVPTQIPALLDRLSFRYPSPLVDAIVEHVPGQRVVAVKNVAVTEEFFQGHFPGRPTMPGVLMIESLAQAAAILLLDRAGEPSKTRAFLRGVDEAKFRRQVVPGDQVRVEVTLLRERSRLARVRGQAFSGDQVVAEAQLLIALVRDNADIHPSAHVQPGAQIGAGTIVGPNAVIGPRVTIGQNCRIGASAVVDGWTAVGDGTEIFPFASIGLSPQDLKYRGEDTRVEIGRRNIFREFVTVHRGTAGGGGVTSIGDRNVFMAYAHVAHDSRIGNDTIFGPGATLGGHVLVEDFATISAYSGIHQFCRIGRHAFLGGYSVVTKDAPPFAKTVGNRPARNYGLNTIGLVRRKFAPEVIDKLRHAYRYLLTSRLNTSRALLEIEQDPDLQCDEVQYLIDFIRSSKRGVVLRRPTRRVEEMVVDD
jgi:UDP-N-acetylglucosamine acyltransferase